MKKLLLLFILFFNLVFLQEDCFDITNPLECYLTDGCQWFEDEGCYHSEEGGGDWSCSDINNLYECYNLDCQWIDNPNMLGGGSCIESSDDLDCLSDCEGIENINPEDNPIEACDLIISLVSFDPGFTNCLQDCDEQTMIEINQTVDACYECLENDSIDCSNIFNDEENSDNYCTDLSQNMCINEPSCDWIINYEQIGNDLIPIEECVQVGDEPDGCFSDVGEWFCVGCELFIDYCQYYNCTENGWSELETLDTMECNNNDSECSDLSYQDCQDIEYCEWISDNAAGSGICVDDVECSDLTQDECTSSEACEWASIQAPNGYYETCVDSDDWGGEDFGCYENGEWYGFGQELFISECDYLECTLNGWVGPFTLNSDNCSDNNLECSDLSYQDCQDIEYCEWISDNANPTGGSCIDASNDNGPPECLDDCEGIEDINPSENPYEACDWIISMLGFDSQFGCAHNCDDETMIDINEIIEACYECLENDNIDCANVFDDEENIECFELNYVDCIESDECEWIITNNWGGYSCVEEDNQDDCSEFTLIECMENSSCEPILDSWGEFLGCEELNNQQGFGSLYGRVEYLYGDYIDFVPYAILQIESMPSNSDIYSFEVMADAEGYYMIQMPAGAYIATAFANEESLSLDILIIPNDHIELNFLLGDWSGPTNPGAYLSLGENQAVSPGSDVVLPLYLSSNESVGGVQFTIEITDSSLSAVEIQSIDPCFTAEFNEIDDGQLIGIIFSLDGCSYPAEEMLQIANMVFNLSPFIPVGNEMEVFFNSTIVSDSIGNEIPSYGEGIVVMVGAKGDVNGDNEINILDVVMIVSFALYTETPNDSEFWASDINDDGTINILDVVTLVNLILDF